TVTSSTPTPASTRPPDDFGNVGSVTVTTQYTRTTDDFGKVGSVPVTSPTVSAVPPDHHGDVGDVTITEPTGQTPTFVTAAVTTLIDADGVPTATLTSIPSAISTPQTTILTNSLGQPTATEVTSVLATPTVRVETDSNGVPTATVTSYPTYPTGSPGPNVTVYYTTYGQYFVGMFLPTLLAILLSIPIRILDLNAKLFQPWHELTHRDGAAGRESLCLETSGWQSVVTSVRSLFGGQALVFLTTALVMSSALLVPLSAEAVAFRLAGDCYAGSMSAKNCAYVLSVFAQPAKATAGLLSFMAVTVLMVLGFLLNWQSGVSTNPWSICGVASLSLNSELRRLYNSLPAGADAGKMPNGLLERVLVNRRFGLEYFYGPNGRVEYGIVVQVEYPEGHRLHTAIEDAACVVDNHRGHDRTKTKHHLPFLMLGYPGRLLFLFVLCGLLAVILYYNNTGGDTPFENFMDSEAFGVKFLFTAIGVIITFFWSSFFSSIAVMSPYHLLSTTPQSARHSILLAPPTNAISGIWSGIRRRHMFLAIVALTSVLSEILTIFLANVPFRVTQTYLVHRICTWTAVGIICVMVLVVIASFYVKWPHMPVNPSTIAGAVYYVCDSWMLERFEGVSILKRKERDERVEGMGLRYGFGDMRGL
ncbi:uncharacterized protein BCR38DRAFT_304169, partial [Pseudomassariella vexata]